MRLNGGRHEGSLSSSSTTEADDMIETENESLRERVSDLEKKVLEQGDEIVCLRSTLADALRRINQLEGSRPASTSTSSASATPLKNGYGLLSHHRGTPGQLERKDSRYRSPASEPNGLKEPLRRMPSYQTPSCLPQRVVHYQSTGSLHSDSPSSSSVSPVPTSPSPKPSTPAPSSTPSVGTLSKRWSSAGDFNAPPNVSQNAARLATKSLFNLYMKPNPSHSPQLKHGTHTATYNDEEGTLRMWVRGRPVILYAQSAAVESYDIARVAPPPHAKLRLDWVYGYRGRDCRANLHLLPTGEIVYFVAAVVVLYNVDEQTQRHYLGHNDDVKCLAIHPNKLLVATGQAAGHDSREGRPHIRVWNSVSLNTVCTLGLGEFERSISCLSFSKADGGALLCAVDESNGHNISIWDWQKGDKGHKITDTKCSVDIVVAAEFHPLDRNCIVTCGQGHVAFWTLDAGGTLYKRTGSFERDKPKYVTCLAFTHAGDTVTGDSNGNVIVWTRGTNTISRVLRGAHEGPVFSVCVLKDGSLVTAGGKDGRLFQFDTHLQPTGFEAQIAEHLGGVRTVAEGRGSQLLVGTTRNCVLVGSAELGFAPAVLGHSDELWALAPHPSLPQFLTAGYDRIVQLWDSMSHSVVWSKDIAEQAQSATFSPDGSVIVIGATTGRWLVMDAQTREVCSAHSDGAEPIQVVRFSPDGRYLALGSRDNCVYMYQVGEDARKFSRVGRCTGHSSFITHFDWSADSQYLRTNSGDYELLFWNAGVCRQVTQSASMRDIEWATHTCVLAFESVGVWPDGADGTDVNACHRSRSESTPHLLATADDFGKVKLYSYPASQPRSLSHSYGGHSSHVTDVTFLFDDSRLISTGGKDTSVMQWRIV